MTTSPQSDRHPGGWGIVPVALMLDGRAKVKHRAVYAALASAIDFEAGSGSARVRRVAERAGVRVDTARRVLAELSEWGFVRVEAGAPGGSQAYRLLPTQVLERALTNDPLATPSAAGRKGLDAVERGPGGRFAGPLPSHRGRAVSGRAPRARKEGGRRAVVPDATGPLPSHRGTPQSSSETSKSIVPRNDARHVIDGEDAPTRGEILDRLDALGYPKVRRRPEDTREMWVRSIDDYTRLSASQRDRALLGVWRALDKFEASKVEAVSSSPCTTCGTRGGHGRRCPKYAPDPEGVRT